MAHAFKEGESRVIDRLEPYHGVVRLAVTQDGRVRFGDEPGMIRGGFGDSRRLAARANTPGEAARDGGRAFVRAAEAPTRAGGMRARRAGGPARR
ncbi:hypothetical protein C6Q17_09670 [Burkholderia contaminans]|nr:hypothetical protein C6Q17_09670 [Burkholderia contaminans]